MVRKIELAQKYQKLKKERKIDQYIYIYIYIRDVQGMPKGTGRVYPISRLSI